MPKQSAGLLLFRVVAGSLEVLLVHPGGPVWAKKDDGSWSIPKGEFSEVDRAAWFEIEEAKRKIHQGQVPLIEELERMVSEKRVYG